MGVLSGLIKGSSKLADFGAILTSFHLKLASLRSSAWFEHVESKANLSDGGSRVGIDCPEARAAGIPLTFRDFPDEWPRNVLTAPPEVWLHALA